MKNILLLHFDFLSKLGGQKVGSSQMHTTGHFVVDLLFRYCYICVDRFYSKYTDKCILRSLLSNDNYCKFTFQITSL